MFWNHKYIMTKEEYLLYHPNQCKICEWIFPWTFFMKLYLRKKYDFICISCKNTLEEELSVRYQLFYYDKEESESIKIFIKQCPYGIQTKDKTL